MPPSSTLPRSFAWRAYAVFLFSALLAPTGCGGESTPAPESAHAASAKHTTEAASPSESSEPEEEAESTPRADCDDGTCFECGASSCLQGWYCDENAQGGPACSWLPECGKKLDCACIGKALGSACSCSEAGGGLHVKCK